MASPNQVTKDFSLARTSLIMGAHAITQKLRQGQPLLLMREPDSKVSKNDVMIVAAVPGGNRKIGYLPLGLADEVAPIMDRNIKVIARKAPNVLYGVCQIAYIKPDEVVEPAPAPAPEPPPEEIAPGEFKLPEGVTQADLDAGTELPPLGDSRRPHRKEPTDAEPTPDADADLV